MESDVNSVLNQVLKIAKVESAGELTNDALMKMNKDSLVKFVVNLSKLAGKTIEVCKSAAGTIDDLKTEQLDIQRRLIEAQHKQNEDVQQTVNTEMKSWSEIVKKDLDTSSATVTTVRNAVKSVEEEDTRCKNLIVYGARDFVTEDIGDIIDEIFQQPRDAPELGRTRTDEQDR